jgi:hypothetical protein
VGGALAPGAVGAWLPLSICIDRFSMRSDLRIPGDAALSASSQETRRISNRRSAHRRTKFLSGGSSRVALNNLPFLKPAMI